MSMAWETTTEDVETVLKRHNVKVSEERLQELHDSLDTDAIEDAVLNHTDMDAQTSSMLSDIEVFLMEEGVIPKGEKLFAIEETDHA